MKKNIAVIYLPFFLWLSNVASAQETNMVVNGGFESPGFIYNIALTPDRLDKNSPPSKQLEPGLDANTGSFSLGLMSSISTCEIAGLRFKKPLLQGEQYVIELSLRPSKYICKRILKDIVLEICNDTTKARRCQRIVLELKNQKQDRTWARESVKFKALGGEQFLLFKNNRPQVGYNPEPQSEVIVADSLSSCSYYLYDDFSVMIDSKQNEEAIKSMPDSVFYFETASHVFDEKYIKDVESWAECIKANNLRVSVTGYTDLEGSEDLNGGLRKRRAAYVKQTLVKLGVLQEMVTIIDESSVSKNLKLNCNLSKCQRRVEIHIHPKLTN